MIVQHRTDGMTGPGGHDYDRATQGFISDGLTDDIMLSILVG